ncbi:MAG TPA: shikimate kinase [Acidimicrobiales bacterium]|nr:shikimate kinase [Acidimicrobiales bacterium]
MADTDDGHARVLLIGMMGAGKSLAGQLVASRLGWPLLDTDEAVERRRGSTVAQLFTDEGEPAFRAWEAQVLAEALTQDGPLVVAVAGGAVLSADNRRLIRDSGLVVWLRAELATLATRVVTSDHRPLLAGDTVQRLADLYAARRSHYQELADAVIDVDALGPDEVADRVIAAWHAARGRSPVGGGRGA